MNDNNILKDNFQNSNLNQKDMVIETPSGCHCNSVTFISSEYTIVKAYIYIYEAM